ncbi:MAG: hypothetical protein ABI448_05865 [Bacteroidia bacterium]
MAFIKRQENTIGFVANKNQNDNTKRQVFETFVPQKVNPSIEKIDVSGLKTKENKRESLFHEDDEENYVPVRCKWIDELYNKFDERGKDSWLKTLYGEKEKRVEWISIHYRCLLDCVIRVSEMKSVEWADLAELTNGLTFLITSIYFKELPEDYPFTKDIILLRDKLKCFCLETQDEEYVQFSLKFSTKKDLILQRYELSTVYSKINFNQLQLAFKTEINKQKTKLKQEQEAIQSTKEKPWQAKYRALKRQQQDGKN